MLRNKINVATVLLLPLGVFAAMNGAFVQQILDVQSEARSETNSKPAKRTRVMVQDFEKASSLPTVWVVNVPNKNASVQLSTNRVRGHEPSSSREPCGGIKFRHGAYLHGD